MPLHESLPIKVTLVVEVDGHTLTFERSEKASGGRYHGRPAPESYRNWSVLEAQIQQVVEAAARYVSTNANRAMRQLYPVDPKAEGELKERT